MNDMDFTGKRVLVIGGSSGIGNGISHAFKDRGAEVHIWGTRPQASDYDGVEGSDLTGLKYTQFDVSDFDALDAYTPDFETLDVVVMCQGIAQYGRKEFARTGWDQVMDVNLNSVMHCSMKFHDMLQQSRGSLIIVSSVAAYGTATIGNPAYAASKAGAARLCTTLGKAWAPEGIRVNGIAPGLVATKMTKVTTENEKRRNAVLSSIPTGRLGEPSDMAGAALFLASPLADYITGQTLTVDGGLTLG